MKERFKVHGSGFTVKPFITVFTAESQRAQRIIKFFSCRRQDLSRRSLDEGG